MRCWGSKFYQQQFSSCFGIWTGPASGLQHTEDDGVGPTWLCVCFADSVGATLRTSLGQSQTLGLKALHDD